MRASDYDAQMRRAVGGGQAAGGASTDELFEIPTDDKEDMQYEACFEEGEDDMEDVGEMELDPQPTELEPQTGSGGTHAYKANLWAFAAPIAAHKRVLSDVSRCAERTHMLLLTRTAHPGLLIACREAALKVITLPHGCSHHSK